MKGDLKQERLKFWLNKLSGDLPKLNLAFEHAHKSTSLLTGAGIRVEIPLKLCEALTTFAKKEKCST